MFSWTSVGARIVRSHLLPQERTVNCVLIFVREPHSFSRCGQIGVHRSSVPYQRQMVSRCSPCLTSFLTKR
jgi:hypothetical protein